MKKLFFIAIICPGLVNTLERPGDVSINAPGGVGAAHLEKIPSRCRITMEVQPSGPFEEYGFYLRADAKAEKGYKVDFSANNKIVHLGNTDIKAVSGLEKPVKLELILYDDIIDLCIDNKRCIVNRTVEQKGEFLWFFAKHGSVKFTSITMAPLVEE